MKATDFLKALNDIDNVFVQEASVSVNSNGVKRFNRKTAIIIVAAVLALMLVACGIIAVANIEVYTDDDPSVTVDERIEIVSGQTLDEFHSHMRELMEDHGIAEEDVIAKSCDEYLGNGYYFDEMLIATKDKLVGRIITDAKNFTFDVEFIGFFYNEKTEEFKTVSQTAALSGGKIEFVMNAEKGWICYGGFMPRTHPEEELARNNGVFIIKYGDKPSVKAMNFMDEWSEEHLYGPANSTEHNNSDFAVVNNNFYTSVSSYLSNKITDPNERIEAVLTNCEMQTVLAEDSQTQYERKELENGNFFELGYAYNKEGFVVFADSTDPEYHCGIHAVGIFYNADKDQYRVLWRHLSGLGRSNAVVINVNAKQGWQCIGVVTYAMLPDENYEEIEIIDSSHFTHVVGDETDSQEFLDKIIKETEMKKQSYIGYFKDHINEVKPQMQPIQSNG